MADNKTVRIKQRTRRRLKELQKPGEDYSDVLNRILPDPDEEGLKTLQKSKKVVVTCNDDVHEQIMSLSDGVPAHKVVDYWLLMHGETEETAALKLMLDIEHNKTSQQ
jgi:hypothetical protein